MAESHPIPTNPRFQDLRNREFAALTVLEYRGQVGTNSLWLCRCQCGITLEVRSGNLKSGNSTSCGCLGRERARRASITHGLRKSPEYGVWWSMLSRCSRPGYKQYDDYGGRGIQVCERWHSFENFIADMGRRPSAKHQIDRRDNNGNYDPTNCRWATRREQSLNRRDNHLIEFQGTTKTLTEWAEQTGQKVQSLWSRLQRGWSIEDALSTPPKTQNRK